MPVSSLRGDSFLQQATEYLYPDGEGKNVMKHEPRAKSHSWRSLSPNKAISYSSDGSDLVAGGVRG